MILEQDPTNHVPLFKGKQKNKVILTKKLNQLQCVLEKKRTPAELKASVDESYGKWGKRKKDWKKA